MPHDHLQSAARRYSCFRSICDRKSPEHIEWCGTVRDIPFKRFSSTLVNYLEKPEIDALLAAPDQHTDAGRRDYAMLLFLYNAGARASEAAEVRIGDVQYTKRTWKDGEVEIHDKGGKTRLCPLWPKTVRTLDALIGNRRPDDYVFLSRIHQPFRRTGIWSCVKRHAKTAAATMPSIAKKQVSPHVLRHSAACHLLRSGVDLNTIRIWLGHVDIKTTNIYAQIDLEMKAKALANCEITDEKPLGKRWRDQTSLMEFLRNL